MKTESELKELREVQEKATEHWEFLERWLRIVFIDAFVHGYKHGKDKEVKDEA